MSRIDRVIARKMEAVVSRRRPKAGHKTGVIVHKQHRQGDRWWRMRFADLIEKRSGEPQETLKELQVPTGVQL